MDFRDCDTIFLQIRTANDGLLIENTIRRLPDNGNNPESQPLFRLSHMQHRDVPPERIVTWKGGVGGRHVTAEGAKPTSTK